MQKQQIEEHLFRLVSVVRNAAGHRSLLEHKGSLSQNYWILIFNNFLDMAILDWCKVFGSHSEPTHWKNVVPDHKSFRTGLLGSLGLSEKGWEEYWQQVKEYRDNLLSHHQKPPNLTHYPRLDIVLEASFYYYEWLIQKLGSLGYKDYPDDLRAYYDRVLVQSSKFSQVAYDSTKNLQEEVY